MIFTPTQLEGAYVVEPEQMEDSRGFFARTWCREEFRQHGLNANLVQCSISFNRHEGTLRGMHLQAPPHEEAKLVRCTTGAIYDVVLDLRPDSPTFRRWMAVELSAANRRMVYIPEGCAHGLLTLADNTEIFYQMSAAYHADSQRGVRFNDEAFAILWPRKPVVISPQDEALADFSPEAWSSYATGVEVS